MKEKVKGINHIGIAVESIDKVKDFYENVLGLRFEGIEEIEEQKIRAGIFYVGDIRIELLEPTSEDSPVAKFLDKKGPGIHHIAFSVERIEEKLDFFSKKDILLIDKTPRKGIHGTRIAFIHPKSTGGTLVEICE